MPSSSLGVHIHLEVLPDDRKERRLHRVREEARAQAAAKERSGASTATRHQRCRSRLLLKRHNLQLAIFTCNKFTENRRRAAIKKRREGVARSTIDQADHVSEDGDDDTR